MSSNQQKKPLMLWAFVFLVVLSSVVLVTAKATMRGRTLTVLNANDSLMALAELLSEGGGRYGGCHVEAQRSHAEMVESYVKHMNSRHVPLLLQFLPFPGEEIVEHMAEKAEVLANTVPSGKDQKSQNKAKRNIEEVAISLAEFFKESGFLDTQMIEVSKREPISSQLQDSIYKSLAEAHEKAEAYVSEPNLANAEAACMSNRRAIVYLYLARFHYQEILGEEMLKRFRTDINRALYQNRVLQESDAMRGGAGQKGSDHWMLERHSNSERRRLRLLQAIIDNDLEEAHVLLQTAILTALSDNPDFDVTP